MNYPENVIEYIEIKNPVKEYNHFKSILLKISGEDTKCIHLFLNSKKRRIRNKYKKRIGE